MQMRDVVARRIGDAADDVMATMTASSRLTVLASNPLMLGLIAHTLAQGDDGASVAAASSATAVTMRAIRAMVTRVSAERGVAGASADARVMMRDVARLAAGSMLQSMLAELMLEAHARRTREVTASDVRAALVAAGATARARRTGHRWNASTPPFGCARALGSSRRSNRAATRASAAST